MIEKKNLDLSPLEGTFLNEDYQLGKIIGRGSSGSIFEVSQTASKSRKLICKISQDKQKEVMIIKECKKILKETKIARELNPIPHIQCHGKFAMN